MPSSDINTYRAAVSIELTMKRRNFTKDLENSSQSQEQNRYKSISRLKREKFQFGGKELYKVDWTDYSRQYKVYPEWQTGQNGAYWKNSQKIDRWHSHPKQHNFPAEIRDKKKILVAWNLAYMRESVFPW